MAFFADHFVSFPTLGGYRIVGSDIASFSCPDEHWNVSFKTTDGRQHWISPAPHNEEEAKILMDLFWRNVPTAKLEMRCSLSLPSAGRAPLAGQDLIILTFGSPQERKNFAKYFLRHIFSHQAWEVPNSHTLLLRIMDSAEIRAHKILAIMDTLSSRIKIFEENRAQKNWYEEIALFLKE